VGAREYCTQDIGGDRGFVQSLHGDNSPRRAEFASGI
jgi:hypothetical protein